MATRQQSDTLASAAAGDEIAFQHIITAHHEDMRRVCLAISGDHWANDPLNESLRRPRVSQIAIGPDGTAWVAVGAGDERGHRSGLYVITPEAVAGIE